jgi:hypothetical protein
MKFSLALAVIFILIVAYMNRQPMREKCEGGTTEQDGLHAYAYGNPEITPVYQRTVPNLFYM